MGNRFDLYAIKHIEFLKDHLAMLNMGWDTIIAILLLLMGIKVSLSFWKKSISYIRITTLNKKMAFIQFFTLLLISVVFIRGGLQHRPLKQSQSIFSNYKIANDSVANSIYRLFYLLDYYFENSKNDIYNLVSKDTNIQTAVNTLSILYDNTNYDNSLKRTLKATKVDNNNNIVLIIIESFASDFIHCMGSKNKDTPYFDSLMKEGVLFDNFYANGTHTNEGLGSLLSGYPLLPQGAILTRPELIDGVQTLQSILKQYNYSTSFIYGGRLTFDNMFSFLNVSGMDHFIGLNHFPKNLNQTYWGIIDEHVYEKAMENILKTPMPFISTILTLSNHHPWDSPLDNIDPLPVGTENLNRRNTCRYTDWALHHFITGMKNAKLYDDTIFIISADHGQYLYNDYEIEPRNYRIPLLILNSGLNPHINHTLGSQIDLIPTVLDLMGKDVSISSFGRSLLDRTIQNRFVPILQNGIPALLYSDHIYLDKPNADGGTLFKFSNQKIDSIAQDYINLNYKSLSQSLLFAADYSIKNFKFYRK